jgi:hypothetical protein
VIGRFTPDVTLQLAKATVPLYFHGLPAAQVDAALREIWDQAIAAGIDMATVPKYHLRYARIAPVPTDARQETP